MRMRPSSSSSDFFWSRWNSTERRKPYCTSKITSILGGAPPAHSILSFSCHATFLVATVGSSMESVTSIGLSARKRSIFSKLILALTLTRSVRKPVERSARWRMRRRMRKQKSASHARFMANHRNGKRATMGSLIHCSTHHGVDSPSVPPEMWSMMSNANIPASSICITSSDADARSLVADASTRYLVLASTFLNTSSSCFVLITSVIADRFWSSCCAPWTSLLRSSTRMITSRRMFDMFSTL
mmetsp:Transcript_63726/g.151959  ORF Transcript_63726/g.151959 Transcript_63726/m.151959 type:complete len:243 (+) Transcript_63726:225-953(+)